jgi:hypothetical protein
VSGILLFYRKRNNMEANAYLEALRYLANAKETLQKAGRKDGLYEDIKYVKAASGIAYFGVLLALDAYLKSKEGAKYKKPKSIEDYQKRVGQQNKKLAALLSDVYGTLHLEGYYQGTNSVKIVTLGFDATKEIIEYIKPVPPKETKVPTKK